MTYRIHLFEIYSYGKLPMKIATWSDNDQIRPGPKAKLLNYIWKLNLIPKSNYLLGNLL